MPRCNASGIPVNDDDTAEGTTMSMHRGKQTHQVESQDGADRALSRSP